MATEIVAKVTKASGELEAFDEEKLRSSLLRSGAPAAAAERVLNRIRPRLRSGIETRSIHEGAHALLLEEGRPWADRYDLKRAIFDLGPSGFPFEKYVAALLDRAGNRCELNQIIPGRCVTHEVDIVSTSPTESAWIECKFHNLAGMKTDVKVTLYCYARFLDLKAGPRGGTNRAFRIITNTKFTTDAIRYANCVGLRLTGWNTPESRPLQALIEESGLYPITCLSALKPGQKRKLLERGIALVSELRDSPRSLRGLGLDRARTMAVLAEADALITG